MPYFDEISNKVRDEISEIKKNPILFLLDVLLNAFVFVFVAYALGGLYILFSSFYTIINPIIGIATVFLLGGLLLYKKDKICIPQKKYLLLIGVLLWIIPQLLVVSSIEIGYNDVKNNYSQEYLSLKESGFDDVNTSWSLADRFYKETTHSYGNKEVKVPSRQFYSSSNTPLSISNLILDIYFLDINGQPRNGYRKLIVVQKVGACGEFAQSMGLLLKDVTGYDTRMIGMDGKDHALPEVKIDGDWWVFDRSYTTGEDPVKVQSYASFVEEREVFNSIHDLHELGSNKSLLIEHGFNSSNLTITAMYDPTVAKDEEPAVDANVEIFAYDNSYDPLVSHGKTDSNGQYFEELRSDKKYMIVVKDRHFITSSVGFIDVFLSNDNDSSMVVYLHKYE